MTKREFLETVIAQMSDNEEVVAVAKADLDALNRKNDKAKEKRMAKNELNAPIEKAIVEYLTEHTTALASDLANATNLTTSKIVAVANKMVERNELKVARVKIAKVGERNQYSL